MSFERISKHHTGAASSDDPQLSVYAGGTVRFNAAAVDRWFESVDRVSFYLDQERGRLGVDRGGSEDTYKLSDSGAGLECSFRTVLTRLGLTAEDIEGTIRLTLEHDPSEGLLVADLAPLQEVSEA